MMVSITKPLVGRSTSSGIIDGCYPCWTVLLATSWNVARPFTSGIDVDIPVWWPFGDDWLTIGFGSFGG